MHRAEIMTLGAPGQDALEEARRVGERFTAGSLESNWRSRPRRVSTGARYIACGASFEAAEAGYREASRFGLEPQPGLALLRLGQGNGNVAAAAIRRALSETTRRSSVRRCCPRTSRSCSLSETSTHARTACASSRSSPTPGQRRAGCDVRVRPRSGRLAGGDPGAALVALRRAWQAWQELEAPYEAARMRVLVGLACRALGDDDTAALELEAARDVFAQLGAAPDLAAVDSLARRRRAEALAHGLTARELQVLRLVAAGKSNHAIAVDLFLSDHTVRDTSRTSSARWRVVTGRRHAFAFEHDLI